MRCSALLNRSAVTLAAAVPPNYSNIPYKKESITRAPHHSRNAFCARMTFMPVAPLGATAGAGKNNGSTFIDPSSSTVATQVNNNDAINSFRQHVCASTDVSMRPLLLHLDAAALRDMTATIGISPAAAATATASRASFGEVLEQLSCRWAAKFYGKVTFGPRNYPYPTSRWLARRFKMKKHRIVKRFRFRRYKLAAVANLPFAKMIRVGMLPELKSSKTKKGDAVDNGLSAQLVSAAQNSASVGKAKGKRTRPKSKYQV